MMRAPPEAKSRSRNPSVTTKIRHVIKRERGFEPIFRQPSRAEQCPCVVDQNVELLAPVYGWFTEGFDTLDLKQAKTRRTERLATKSQTAPTFVAVHERSWPKSDLSGMSAARWSLWGKADIEQAEHRRDL